MRIEDLSDGELEALAGEKPDYVQFAAAAAARHGVRPELAARMVRQESGGDPAAVSGKGARGVMQLMPETAHELGVDPEDPIQNIDGGLRYFKRQLDDFGGDERLALAAYNAGPGAVRKHGGVPPFKETQHYVDAILGGAGQDTLSDQGPADLSHLSDAQLEAIAGNQAPAAAAPAAPAPKAAPVPRKAPAVPMKAVAHDVADSLSSGATSGLAGLGDAIMRVMPFADFARAGTMGANLGRLVASQVTGTKMGAPLEIPTLAGSLQPHLYAPKTTPGKYARSVGEMIPNAALPGSIPAKIASVVLPGLASEGAAQLAEKLGGGEKTQAVARAAGAVAGGGIASMRRVPIPKGASLEELKATKDRAYAKVDGSGFKFGQDALKKLSDDIVEAIEEAGGAELNEQAAKMARRVQSLADRGSLSLSQLDKVRGLVGEKVIAKGEATVGYKLRDMIDGLIDSADVPEMRAAREAHMRYAKAKDIADRIESADLAQAGSGTGGNANAVRQKLKPLIDPKSNQRMKNATPEERAALRRVVKGGTLQNTMRLLSAFDPTHGRLGALLQGGAAIPTHGASLLTIPAGMAATFGERSLGKANLRYLQDLVAAGGKRPQPVDMQVFSPVDRAALAGLTTTQAYPSVPRRETARLPQPQRQSLSSQRRVATAAR